MRVFAPAKVNLGLSVRGIRRDGYHELHSLMVPLAEGDELELHPAPHLSLVVRGAHLPTDERNLVYRAARAYLDEAGCWEGARIVLHKRLPLASGVGAAR
ncbi:4-(cytidine 5'-diphospho)-2-C-methyl-D-erythritol kinase, partial [Deinococcus pimensis]|uniref:4-(cytidine 5'-diphospho)-2-C-methyl-D-erythritol kinase n=1 Tax=Deinococcus pimensis TaxID=309888 RepID=UPI003CCBC8DC